MSRSDAASRTGLDLPGLPASLYYLERMYGHRVPRCPFCESNEMRHDHIRASMWCLACGHELASESIEYVPQDVRAAAYERRGGKIVEVPL